MICGTVKFTLLRERVYSKDCPCGNEGNLFYSLFKPHRKLQVIQRDDIFDHIKGLSAPFGYVVQQVDNLAILVCLFVDGGDDSAWAIVAQQRIGQKHVDGVEQQRFHPARCIIVILGEDRVGEI